MKSIIQLAFENIYENNLWGIPSDTRKNKKFYSGGGTEIENDFNNSYRNLLQDYLNKSDVKTVVEIGCGDFEITGSLNLDNIEYIGYDVVESLVKYNNENFGKNNIKFIHDTNILSNKILKADLIIIKDVLQHLPLEYYLEFIKNIPNNFKYNLITNDYIPYNYNINFGEWTGNNFSEAPFNMKTNILIEWKQKFIEAGCKITLSLENK